MRSPEMDVVLKDEDSSGAPSSLDDGGSLFVDDDLLLNGEERPAWMDVVLEDEAFADTPSPTEDDGYPSVDDGSFSEEDPHTHSTSVDTELEEEDDLFAANSGSDFASDDDFHEPTQRIFEDEDTSDAPSEVEEDGSLFVGEDTPSYEACYPPPSAPDDEDRRADSSARNSVEVICEMLDSPWSDGSDSDSDVETANSTHTPSPPRQSEQADQRDSDEESKEEKKTDSDEESDSSSEKEDYTEAAEEDDEEQDEDEISVLAPMPEDHEADVRESESEGDDTFGNDDERDVSSSRTETERVQSSPEMTKVEEEEEEDVVMDEAATVSLTTIVVPEFTAEEMAGLAEILAVCPPPPTGAGSVYHSWARVRWANWSLADRVFYTVASRRSQA